MRTAIDKHSATLHITMTERKNPHAVALGRRGGKARAEKLGPEKLAELMSRAGRASSIHKPRCPCGANTLHRAKIRAFDCCKRANIPGEKIQAARELAKREAADKERETATHRK